MKKELLILVSVGLVFVLSIAYSGHVFAQVATPAQPGPPSCGEIPNLQCAETIFANVLKTVLSLGGILAFLFLIAGGFKYLTAGGDVKAAGEAQKIITASVTGLVLTIAAYALMTVLSNILYGSNSLLQFNVLR